jgi:hypothetical protein
VAPASPETSFLFWGGGGFNTFIDVLLFATCFELVQFIIKIQQDATVYQDFIIPYLYEAQHVSGDTPPIIRSLKLPGSLWFFIRGRLLDV